MEYVIKHNLPDGIINTSGLINPFNGLQRNQAVKRFLFFAKQLAEKNISHKTFIRNAIGKSVRGTIQVEIDGFYYYMELYQESSSD